MIEAVLWNVKRRAVDFSADEQLEQPNYLRELDCLVCSSKLSGVCVVLNVKLLRNLYSYFSFAQISKEFKIY